MATPAAYPFEKGYREFDRTVAAAQREIALQIRLAISQGNLQRRDQRLLQLARVLAILDQLGAYTDPAARELVAQAHEQGAARTLRELAGLHITAPEIPGAFAGVSYEAVRELQDSIVGKLKASRETVGRSVSDVFAHAGRRAALRAVLGAEGSPRTAARQMARDLLGQGEVGFVDAAGKRWKLETYAQMAVRTVTREAVAQGSLARMASHGINLARWTKHGDACHICSPWLGRLVSLDGTTRDFEGEAVADLGSTPGIPAHPNCRCSLSPVAVRVERLRRELQTTGLV